MNTTENTVAIVTKPRKLNFKGKFVIPQHQFTLDFIMAKYNFAKNEQKKPTRLAAYFFIQKKIKDGTLTVCGKKKCKGRGRSPLIYKLAAPQVEMPSNEVTTA